MNDIDELDTATPETDGGIEASLNAAFGPETAPEVVVSNGGATAPATDSGTTTAAALEPPKHWNEEAKGFFTKAPPDLQKHWIAREAERDKSLDSKYQEIAAFRREREQLDEMFGPYTRDLELRGATRPQFIQSLLGAHKFLLEKPAEALKWLAQEYGIDPSKLSESPAAKPDTAITKLEAEVKQTRDELGRFTAQQKEAETKANLSKVQAFAQAKDDKGNLIHPHFDAVAEDIHRIMQTGLRDLDQAYQKAVRMNDEIFAKVQADQAAAKTATAEAERKAQVDKAKRAGVTSTTSNANGSSRPVTLTEQLEQGFAGYGT